MKPVRFSFVTVARPIVSGVREVAMRSPGSCRSVVSMVPVVLLLAACVSERPLDSQLACPCAPGWTCDEAHNVCVANAGGGTGSGGDNGGNGGEGIADAGIVTIEPSYACGPPDAGVKCYCGTEPFFPAPVNAEGQQQTYVLPPDPATVVAYTTLAQFDALAVGRWQRTAGQAELICEQVGIEFTADHRFMPMVVATDGTIQPVTALAKSFGIAFGSSVGPELTDGGLAYEAAPTFFDGGQSMYTVMAPWPADYVKLPAR